MLHERAHIKIRHKYVITTPLYRTLTYQNGFTALFHCGIIALLILGH